jgi:tetratricopeptide (TPR) repeat protein
MATDTPSTVSAPQPAPPHGRLEWEGITVARRRQLQTCFDHAKKMAAKPGKYDYDYAHTMLSQCVAADPGNLVYVEAMLENLHKKYNNNKRGGGSGGNRSAFKKATSKKEWVEVLKLGPALLGANPWDVATLRPMAEACAAYGFNEVELRYLKNALDANTKDVEVNKHCAATLARVGQFDQAIGCWRRIGEVRRKDPEVDRMIGQLTLDKTRILSGLGEDEKATGRVVNQSLPAGPTTVAPAAPTVSSHIGSTETAKPAETEKKRAINLTNRQKLERAIAEDPTLVENYVKLADEYLLEDRPSEAIMALGKALSAGGGDLNIQQRMEDAQLRQMRMQLAVAEKRAAADGTPESAQLVEQLREQMHRRELEIYVGRVNRQPGDLGLKFELAVRLKKAGNMAEAEKTFMEVRESPQWKPAATIELGECLQHQQKYSHAMQFYNRAVELTAAGSDVNLKKLALYRAGTLAAGLKQFDRADECLSALSALDANYKDVQSRLDKIRQLRHKG